MTLGRLLADSGRVTIGHLYSRNPANARRAARFVGAGTAVEHLDAIDDGDIWLLSVADDAIGPVASQLAAGPAQWRARTVFHCSGIHTASALAPLAAEGATTASCHPVHSFANPQASLTGFAGTVCTLEGSEHAHRVLAPLFDALGAHIVSLDSGNKPLYHAATAVASNHLVALLDSAVAMLAQTGIDRPTAAHMIKPLVYNTCDNFFGADAGNALTGPIARGDAGTVASHLTALAEKTDELRRAYVALARLALAIARQQQAANSPTEPGLPGHDSIDALLAAAD